MPDSEPEPELLVDIVRRSDAWRADLVTDALIERAARAAFATAATVPSQHEVAVVLTDDAEQRRLNLGFRGQDKPTNVLSFPAGDLPAGDDPQPLGDIVLAYETVLREAKDEGTDPTAHVAHLVIHGVLHLLGHDHEGDEDAAAMEQLEMRLMTELGYADPHAMPRETVA